MRELSDIKYDAKKKLEEAINEAFSLGKSEDFKKKESELSDTIKHAQEAYEFFKVVMNRMRFSDNNLEDTTLSYLKCIGEHLGKIEGIKK